jgi:hypothetical protein
LRGRFPLLFAGKFDTGVYPDEWYWREGMSLPDVTRHMANAWKADLTVAKLALSESIGRFAADLCGWSGTRLGQDTIWWKAPKTKPIAYHQDSSFMDFLEPSTTLTCWVTLDDTHPDAGTLEYAPGSHKWPLTRLPDAFHGQEDHRAQMRAAAEAAGIKAPDPLFIEVPAGSCVFHSGKTWHGSAANITGDRMRRAMGVHMLPENVLFSDRPGGYIYRRYNAPTIRCSMKAIFRCCGPAPGTARNGSKLIARAAYVALREGPAMAMRVTHYAKSGDIHVAYQVFGSGPIDLVLAPGLFCRSRTTGSTPIWRAGSFASPASRA